jgi:hypothetical protein
MEPNMAVAYKLIASSGCPVAAKGANKKEPVNSAGLHPNFRCPHCMHMGSFTPVIPQDAQIQFIEHRPDPTRGNTKAPEVVETLVAGIRVCPNAQCQGIVFIVKAADSGVVCLPNEVLQFDPKGVPTEIAVSLEEAIKCHSARCYKAASLMVRRVLEEICKDRGAKGGDLKARIQALASTIIISKQVLEAADNLRLLGNDAAHVEAHLYRDIGEEEVKLAIQLAQEILKAVYQHESLVAALKALQIKSESPS